MKARTLSISLLAAGLSVWVPVCFGQSGVQAGASSQTAASASAQTKGAQGSAGGQAGGATSVQANRQGAAVASNSSASTSAQANRSRNRSGNSGNSTSLAAGSAMSAELASTVDAKKNKPGDPVKAKSTKPAKCSDGQVIPKGSVLLGHVTEAQARHKGQAESFVGVAFDRAVLRNGEQIPLSNVTIQAIASTQTAADASASMLDDGPAMGGGAAGGGRVAGGGALGGVGGTVGGVSHTAAGVGGAANGAVGSTAMRGSAGAVGGLDTTGRLTSGSQGVFGMPGVALNSATSSVVSSSASVGNVQSSVISSTSQNVHLDRGTELLLASSGSGHASAQKASGASNPHPDRK